MKMLHEPQKRGFGCVGNQVFFLKLTTSMMVSEAMHLQQHSSLQIEVRMGLAQWMQHLTLFPAPTRPVFYILAWVQV